MDREKNVRKLLILIEQLPPGRMSDKYRKEYEEIVAHIESGQKRKEQIKVLAEIGKRINIQCFMCKKIIKKVDSGAELSTADIYHLSADIPAVASIRNIDRSVPISINLTN